MILIRNDLYHRPYRCGDADEALAVGFAVVAVQLADVGAVGNFAGVGGDVAAYLPGGAVVVAYQAGEVEERIFARVVAAEIQGIAGGPDGGLATMPIGVATPVGGEAEEVAAGGCQVARAPATLESRLGEDRYRVHVESGSRRQGGRQGVFDESDLLCSHDN